MANGLYLNLPVRDVERSRQFFAQLGFTHNPQFSDENAVCVVITDQTALMLLNHNMFAGFAPRPICDTDKHVEMLAAISVGSRTEVGEMVAKAVAAGGETYAEPKDYGFMLQHGFRDPDGHVFEIFYMDESARPESN